MQKLPQQGDGIPVSVFRQFLPGGDRSGAYRRTALRGGHHPGHRVRGRPDRCPDRDHRQFDLFVQQFGKGRCDFFRIDREGCCRTVKIMKYDRQTGHPIKNEKIDGKITWVHVVLRGRISPIWTDTRSGRRLLCWWPGWIWK